MAKKEVKDEIAVRFGKKNWLVKALPIAYCVTGVLFMTAVPVCADDIFATAKNAMQTVYTDVAGIATVAAVVCAAVCLFLMIVFVFLDPLQNIPRYLFAVEFV